MKITDSNQWLVLAVLSILPICLRAQNATQAANGKIRVEKVQVAKEGDNLEVRMRLTLDSLEMESNRFIQFTPVVAYENNTATLTPIVIAGRRQYIMYRRVREKEFHKSGQEPMVILRKNGTSQSMEYRYSVPYAEWMEVATLKLAEDLCGCGGHPLTQEQFLLTEWDFNPSVFEVQPVLAYITPTAEPVKLRKESGRAFLDFPVNQTAIQAEYRQNATELSKIRQTIELVKNDSNTRITHISIHGYASPEGAYSDNARLAQGRAEALRDYVCRLFHFDKALFEVQSTPEDWAGLREWVKDSDIPHKEKLLDIIDSDLKPDAKNWKLQTADKKNYEFLLKNVYPQLRHSDYTVEYSVKAFHVEEAKALLESRPQLLSLNEMFLIAQTYEPGSTAFNEVFDRAVRLFPENATANLNAANAAINEGRLQRAASYLDKAGDSPEAVHLRGVLLLLQGKYEEAKTTLEKARTLGVDEAASNLEQLRLKEENIRKLSKYKHNKSSH